MARQPVTALTPAATPAIIEELRLKKFKSFRGAVLPLADLTLVIGRNGSGKSNAIEALEALSRLATGEDIRDAIDGGRGTVDAIRGGVAGCAPYGESSFALGASVRRGDDVVNLDVEIRTEPFVQVVSERLWTTHNGSERDLLHSDPAEEHRADIDARYYNGKRGPNPAATFRASGLLTAQAAVRVPATSKATSEVREAAEVVIDALKAVSVLDPVPSLMRDYVQEGDADELRRRAENLSAVVARLRSQGGDVWQRFCELVKSLPEQEIRTIDIGRSSLRDVVIVLHERQGRGRREIPARLMSDGMLRFVAFATALLEAPVTGSGATVAQRALLIEELENGLYPSQARRIIELVKEEARKRDVRVLATTHSPAMLTALSADDHPNVMLCDRDGKTGGSRLRSLVELPNYTRLMALGTLGDAVIHGRLTAGPDPEATADLERLIAGL